MQEHFLETPKVLVNVSGQALSRECMLCSTFPLLRSMKSRLVLSRFRETGIPKGEDENPVVTMGTSGRKGGQPGDETAGVPYSSNDFVFHAVSVFTLPRIPRRYDIEAHVPHGMYVVRHPNGRKNHHGQACARHGILHRGLLRFEADSSSPVCILPRTQ